MYYLIWSFRFCQEFLYFLMWNIFHKWQCKVDFFVHCKYVLLWDALLFSFYSIEMFIIPTKEKWKKIITSLQPTNDGNHDWTVLRICHNIFELQYILLHSTATKQKSITKIPLSLRKLLIQNRYIEHGYRRAKSSEILLKVHQKQASQLFYKTKLATDARALFDL